LSNRVNNSGVVRAWKEGHTAENGRQTLCTDGVSLWSYDLKIGHRLDSGATVLADYTASGRYRSQTTSCHIGLARRTGINLMMHPLVWETSPMHEPELPF
jgi:hypothetical protein